MPTTTISSTPAPQGPTPPNNNVQFPGITTPGPGKGGALHIIQQPAFDKRIYDLSLPMGQGSSIYRGVMFWDPAVAWAPPIGGSTGGTAGQTAANAPAVWFLYNPSTIAASYALDSASGQANLLYPVATVSANLIVPLQQTVSFTIMFDRTYEVNTPTIPNGLLQLYGVDIDILALKQFTGMFSSIVSTAGSTSPDTTTGISANPFGLGAGANLTSTPDNNTNTTTINQILSGNYINQGVMTVALSYIYFSGPNGGGIGLKYYGYVSGWDVQYTHFSELMVPMRAVVDITFTLLPPANTGSSPGAAPGGATTPAGGTPAQQAASGLTATQIAALKAALHGPPGA
jgi:hypothetical protein